MKPTPIQFLGPLFGQCRIDQDLSLFQLCNRLSEFGIDLTPDQLQAIEDETATGMIPVMDALWSVTGATLGQIERRLAEVERGRIRGS